MGGTQRNFVLNKYRRYPNPIRILCSRSIIVIMGISRTYPYQPVMVLNRLIPNELPKAYLLLSQKGGRTIHRILVVVGIRKLKSHFLGGRQLILTKQLITCRVNTFSIYLVPSPIVGSPMHFTSPTIFIKKPTGYRKIPIFTAIHTPFVKNRNQIL